MRSSFLYDRLFADALAAPLAPAEAFVRHSLSISDREVASRVWEMGRVHVDDLRLPEVAIQVGWEKSRVRWLRDAVGYKGGPVSDEDTPRRVLTLMSNAASALLRTDGSGMILAVDGDEPGREILRWRFVSLAMPSSILIAAAAARLGRAPPATVRLLHSSMAPDGPVAQQHLHHAAMISFEEVWASLRLRALLYPADFQRSLRDNRAWCPGLHAGQCWRSRENRKEQMARHRERSARHMDEWGDLLFNAFIARGLLDRHAPHSGLLRECQNKECKLGRVILRGFLRGRLVTRGPTGTPYPWPADRYRLSAHYRDAMAPERLRRSQEARRAIIRQQSAEERGIVGRAFRYTQPQVQPSRDPEYERLLLQYLRVKTNLHNILVHHPGEHGLRKFLEHFTQIKVYEPLSDRLRPAKPLEPGLNVAATEYRLAPDAWRKQLGPAERDRHGKPSLIEELEPGQQAGEAGWLIHFKRTDPAPRLPLYERAVRKMDEDARWIGNALEQKPARLRRLRGIDICGVEEDQPLWVSAETLRALRRRSCDIAARRPRLRLKPLCLTLHAGEDFRWLTSGTRAVAEPFEWKLIERGDRIGHGIAVTLEPRRWWRQHLNQRMEVKRIDRLQDLAFLAAYTEASPYNGDDRRERQLARRRTFWQGRWLGKEIEYVVRSLGFKRPEDSSRDVLIEQTMLFWKAIGSRTGRRLIGREQRPGAQAPLHEHWLHSYFWERSMQVRAEEKISILVDSRSVECRLLIKARLRLIRQLARWQVPIESNPSSNLVVASLDAMASQDFLAQTVEQARKAGEETLPWTISTDDPITFSTSLADEYAYAWAGMVLRENNPYDPAHARALLDQAAATSMRTRFTLPDNDRQEAPIRRRGGQKR